MKPRAYLIALLVVTFVQIAASSGNAPADGGLLNGVKDILTALTSNGNSENNLRQHNTEDQNQSKIDFTPSSKIPDQKYLEYLMKSADEIWNKVNKFPFIPKVMAKLGDSMDYVARNLHTNKVNESVNNAVDNAIAQLPVSKKVKASIKKYTNSITKDIVSSPTFVRGMNITRHTFEAATVMLSLLTAFVLTFKDEASDDTYYSNLLTTEEPPILNLEDVLKAGLYDLKSGFDKIVRFDHIPDNDNQPTEHQQIYLPDEPKQSPNIEKPIQKIEKEPVKEIAYYITDLLKGAQSNEQQMSQPVNQQPLTAAIQNPIATIHDLFQPNQHASQPIEYHNYQHAHHKLVPVTYHQGHPNLHEPVYQPIGQDSYQHAFEHAFHNTKPHQHHHNAHLQVVQPEYPSESYEEENMSLAVASSERSAMAEAKAW